ncbi:hypothetical protein EDB85DRAFT_2143853 [Lactarius pseudohatsudake]|nr:hypothetical protein EDB85DRAFT_2143853 [Lactarius pseudohatsudake]
MSSSQFQNKYVVSDSPGLTLASTLALAVHLGTFTHGTEISPPLLAASVALLGTFVPVEAALHMKRETNGQRFAMGLPPLPPIRRSPTETAHRRQVSPPPSPSNTGRLEVRHATDNTRLGYVANDASYGPIGLNLDTAHNPAIPDLIVEFSASTLVARRDPEFDAPYYIGDYGALPLSPQTEHHCVSQRGRT